MSHKEEIKINLLNYKFEQKKLKKRIFIETGIYCLIGLLLIGGFFSFDLFKRHQIADLEESNQVLQAELKKTDIQMESLQILKKKQQDFINRRKIAIALIKQRTTFGDVFEEAGELDLSGIILTGINTKKGGASITGISSGHKPMVEFLTWLRESDHFGEVNDMQYQANDDTGEITFTIQTSLEVKQ